MGLERDRGQSQKFAPTKPSFRMVRILGIYPYSLLVVLNKLNKPYRNKRGERIEENYKRLIWLVEWG